MHALIRARTYPIVGIAAAFATAAAGPLRPFFINLRSNKKRIQQVRLSDLRTGERCVVVKVTGHGGFRKRIVEMGFVKGKAVEALLCAPLQDPVKYKVMGYEVSLRRSEAEMIEVVGRGEAEEIMSAGAQPIRTDDGYLAPLSDKQLQDAALRKRRTINVALVGNPNCGKTSLFNFASGAHERVGNYSGVTVDAKEGRAVFEGYEFNIVDLPGTYSLSAFSPEELYVRKQITEHTPDVVINVVDAGNIERNLYLTTQLIDMNLRMVCALNMYDEAEKRGDTIDHAGLGRLFGVPMVPTVFKTGRGVDLLFHIIINMYEGADYVDKDGNIDPEVARGIRLWHDRYGKGAGEDHAEDFATGAKPRNDVLRHIHINHGRYVEQAITAVQGELKRGAHIRHKYSTRYLAIKLLEGDREVEREVRAFPNADQVAAVRDRAAAEARAHTGEDCETAIMDAKYGFIHGALQESGYSAGKKKDTYQLTHLIDGIVAHQYMGFPVFLLLLWLMFEGTFSIGQYPMDWIEAGVEWLGVAVAEWLPPGMLRDMAVDGVIGGVGAVAVFLPQITILYLFISLMEDSGYMARAAFIMDKLMHKMGLHGKSFIPLIMGFGCNVPAVMATRTIESRRSRLVTMLVLPLMSCSARLPIYIMVTGIFFAERHRSWVMLSLYAAGVAAAVAVSRVLSRFVVKGEDIPFVMELPPYRFPTAKAVWRHTWEKGRQYVKKMGGIILVSSIVVWALGYFPRGTDGMDEAQRQEQSYIGRIGKAVEPVFRAQGFDWKLDVGLIAGVGAKEIVASTLGVLYGGGEEAAEDSGRHERMRAQMQADGITPLTAYSFLVFVLLYFPCLATVAAIKSETGSWKWALFAAAYTTALAWAASAAVYQAGRLAGL